VAGRGIDEDNDGEQLSRESSEAAFQLIVEVEITLDA